ncbi:uncharacterized protein LOC122370443 [Amphibalanus amphitrite]|uniref:uncharacterized protein LOC122370443 n=1 Tax=Amphibalanus amphitrite TaxID=1232801 RepID=UPI001C9198B2|nr:uncharacterized protein LOC122370443 [Amphibalanus amphitrite]
MFGTMSFLLNSRFVGRYISLLLLVCCVAATVFLLYRPASAPAVPPPELPWLGTSGDAACRLPPLPLNPPELQPLFHHVPPLVCDPEPAWVTMRGSYVNISATARRAHGRVTCQFTDLLLKDDMWAVQGFRSNSEEGYTLKESDFVSVSCTAEDGETWNNIVAGVRKNAAPHALPLSDLPKDHLPVNILIWGFDSLSRNTFMRKLPRTYAFLRDELQATVLRGYNIVGDGTPQALIPILTGRTERELPDTRRRTWGSQMVNVYPFLWKDFQSDGYVTAFNEDQPDIGTFQYRLRGFNPQPTTHYMRTFFLAASRTYGNSAPYCLRDTPRHKVMSDFVENMYEAYPDRAKFIFSFHCELSHDDINQIEVADADMEAFLQRMKSKGHLDNTVLIVMADHGHRFTAVRSTQQGKLEERLPFFSWTFPTWVRQRYPNAIAALEENVERLTTPFDQYQTLSHLRHWPDGPPPDPANRAVSLLVPGTAARGCAAAGVEAHWCACLRWLPLSINDSSVVAAARAFEEYVLAEQEREAPGACAPLAVLAVERAELLAPQQDVLRFVSSKDADGFVPDLSGSSATEQTLQLRLLAAPADRTFEVTVVVEGGGTVRVRHEDISRLDRYGRQARCVEQRMDHMRKLCYCRDEPVEAGPAAPAERRSDILPHDEQAKV